MNYHGQCGRGGDSAEAKAAQQATPQPVRLADDGPGGSEGAVGSEGAGPRPRFVQCAAGFNHALLLDGMPQINCINARAAQLTSCGGDGNWNAPLKKN